MTGKGYKIVYEGLMKLIVENWPEEDPVKMPFARKVGWEKDMGALFWDINHD